MLATTMSSPWALRTAATLNAQIHTTRDAAKSANAVPTATSSNAVIRSAVGIAVHAKTAFPHHDHTQILAPGIRSWASPPDGEPGSGAWDTGSVSRENVELPRR